MIGIVDYGVGNLASIKNMLRRIEVDSVITSDPQQLRDADRLILPGVGAFDTGISNLHQSGLWDCLNEQVLEHKVPVLGICLGVQLLTEGSDEGSLPGLGWIRGRTVQFDRSKLEPDRKIPNMGWRYIDVAMQNPLCEDLPENPRFYFVHSFHLQCEQQEDVIITLDYGYEFAVGVKHDNIMGVQFHPEKSHKYGMQLLRNFSGVTADCV